MTSKKFSSSELVQTLWGFRHEFLIAAALSCLANVLMLAPTLYMLQVFDRVTVSRSELTLLALSAITVFFFAIMAIAEWLRTRLLVSAGARLDDALSSRVFDACFEFNRNRIEPNPSRAFSDLLQLRQFITGQGLFALFDLPWAPIYLAVLFFLHPSLGWLAIVFAVIQGGLAVFGHRQTVKPAEVVLEANTRANLYLQSKLRNIEVVEAMGMGQNLYQQWQERQAIYKEKNETSLALNNRVAAWSKFIRYTQQSLVLAAGAILVIQGKMTPGAMIAANVLTTRALSPIDQLVSTWRGFSMAKSAFVRLATLLSEYPSQTLRAPANNIKGALTVQKVSTTAPGRKEPILKNINFSLASGQVLAIMGPSGSGKSTLAKSIMGIWSLIEGKVLLDGEPIEELDRHELGPKLGYLPQDVELFEGSIAQNIARFSEVDPEKVIEAAMRTGLHEVILRFPMGYDTPVGVAGGLLSGGQRQRLGLARAIYGRPALVVLDEPNANLDDVGEAALNQTVADLKAAGSSVILITHRPAAVSQADSLLILREGQVHLFGPTEKVLTQLHEEAAANAAKFAAQKLVTTP